MRFKKYLTSIFADFSHLKSDNRYVLRYLDHDLKPDIKLLHVSSFCSHQPEQRLGIFLFETFQLQLHKKTGDLLLLDQALC